MKEKIKKLLTIVLAAVTAICTSQIDNITYAYTPVPPKIFVAPPPSPYSNQEIVKLIDCKIKEFEALAPGVFCVDPSFKDPSKTNIRISYQIIAQMTAVFKRFPRLKNMFVEQIKEVTEAKKFELLPLSDELDHISSYLAGDVKYRPSNGIYYATDAIRIHMNINQIGFINSDPFMLNFYKENFVLFNNDYTPSCITHELGHLFSYIIICHKDPEVFSNFVKTSKNFFAKIKENPDMLKDMDSFSSLPESEEMTSASLKIRELQSEIIKQIMDIAVEKYGHRGLAHISKYGDNKPNEWLAETFVDAVCNSNPTPSAQAMLEYMDTFE